MSHKPDTPVEKQARRHSPALIGIAVALAAALVAFLIFGADTDDVSEMTDAPGSTAEMPAETAEEADAAAAPAPEAGAEAETAPAN